MKRKVILLCVVVVGAVLAYFSLYTVKENELVIITQFGKPARIIGNAGLHLKLPGFIESVNRFDKRAELFETKPTQLLLGDKKPIIISCYVMWKINDPLLFYQSVGQTENAVQKIGDILNSKLSIVLSNYSIQNIINIDTSAVQLQQIEQQATASANENTINKYGIELLETGIQRVAYPAVVINAVYERMRSERTKEADKIRAEGYEVAQKITVEAEMQAREIKAEANKQALILKGEGDQESMRIYTEAYREGGEFFSFLKSLETYSSILGRDTTLVLSTESSLFKYLQLQKEDHPTP
ncbi:MAG: protease modulator HflC [Desulfobulbaceae bacterium]|nr:MAG: protease modulator HflC [Desulfobulbaceae bacterium]